jgi:membrane fusion protein (multidrug efflux system)
MTLRSPLSFVFIAAVFALALAGCDQGKPAAGQASSNGVAPEVGAVTLAAERVAITTELPGRTTPYRVAEVRPQVGGVILKRLFTEGGEVLAGQQLYQIDPATYQAAYDSARASLARAEATVKSASLLAERYRPLVAVNAVSKQDYDNAVAGQRQAEADVASAKAAVDTARINLVYTKVLSPISGRIGRSSVTEGALVTASQVNPLATVQALDPIYVDVTQSTTELLRLQRDLASGQLQKSGDAQAVAHLVLEDGSEYALPGEFLFSEVTVDQSTGSVTLRAVFPNPKRQLLPGMFVHARLEEGVNEQAILVPQQGVTRNQRGQPTALVVAEDNTVQLRMIQVDRAIGDRWLVTDGMKAGDRVIVEGVQKVRPGMQVRVVVAGNVAGQQGSTAR